MSPTGNAKTLDIRIDAKRFPPIDGAGDRPVIEDLELAVRQHEVLGLFGHSGCGKTTTLNLIAGLDKDFQGEIKHGEPGRIGYIFQEPRLIPWRTVEDNLRFVLGPAIDADRRIERWLAEMGLADVKGVFANRLSLGMARRVAIARAFIVEPTLLLMDEPFVSLDEPTAERLRKLLLDLLQQHPATVIFVTHSLREAVMLADRIALLSKPPAHLVRLLDIPLERAARFEPLAVERAHALLAEQITEHVNSPSG